AVFCEINPLFSTAWSQRSGVQVSVNKSLNPLKGMGVGGVTEMYMPCRHIKSSGLRCGSPALRGALSCYLHAKLQPDLRTNSCAIRATARICAGRVRQQP